MANEILRSKLLFKYCQPCEADRCVDDEVSRHYVRLQLVVDMQDAQNAHASASDDPVESVKVVGVAWNWVVECRGDDGRSNDGRVEAAAVFADDLFRQGLRVGVSVRVWLNHSPCDRLKLLVLIRLELLNQFDHKIRIEMSFVD